MVGFQPDPTHVRPGMASLAPVPLRERIKFGKGVPMFRMLE